MSIPNTIWADHSIITISPTSMEAGSTVDITVTSSVVFTGALFPSIKPDTDNDISIGIVGAVVDKVVVFAVTVPDKESLVGNKTFGVGIGDFCGTTSDCAEAPFEITLAGAGAAGGSGGVGAPDKIPRNITTADQFIELLETIVDWIFTVVMIAAVIFIVFAGFQFITAGGEPQAVSSARSKLMYAAVGIVVAVLARGIIAAIRDLIGS